MESCTYDIYIKTIAGCPSECPTPFVSVTGVRSRRRSGSWPTLSCASLATSPGIPAHCSRRPLPPPPRLLQGSQQMLCGGHGVCGYDAKEGNSRCFCNDGFAGADCTGSPEQPPKGLSTLGGVLIGIGLLLGLLIAGLAYLWLRIRALVSGGGREEEGHGSVGGTRLLPPSASTAQRLDPTAYSSLRGGPEEGAAGDIGSDASGSKGGVQ